MATKIIYHQVKPGTDCPDGILSAYIAHRAMPASEIIPWCYQSENIPEVKKGDRLFIVDFSFPKVTLDAWALMDVEIVVLDHHESAWEALQGFTRGVLRFDMHKCGAMLTWEYFYPGKPAPALVRYAQDRDLWNFELPFSEEIHEAVSNMRYALTSSSCLVASGLGVFDLYDKLIAMPDDEFVAKLSPVGASLLEPKRQRIADVASRWDWHELSGHKIPVVKLKPGEERLASDVCAYLYRSMPQVDFVACVSVDAKQERWSLRSDKHGNNFDVKAIAVSKGGGGHRNASGFVCASGEI